MSSIEAFIAAEPTEVGIFATIAARLRVSRPRRDGAPLSPRLPAIGAIAVERQLVLSQGVTLCFCDRPLLSFNEVIGELFHAPAPEADQVIVMSSAMQLVDGLAHIRIEYTAHENPDIRKLTQHAIDGADTDFPALFCNPLVDVISGEMATLVGVKDLQDLDSRYGGLEADALEFARDGHEELECEQVAMENTTRTTPTA